MPETGELPCNVGDIVAGKYRVEGVLGRGGMATVFSAWHEELEQRVALKMLHAGMSSDPNHAKRFVREARNAARIQSEHIARIMDVGRTPDGRVYIVMEHLEGNDLSRVLKQRGALPIEEVVEYLVQACDAIAVAHSLGIVHRDLKPANLFLTRRVDGSTCVKVLDFGIAKAFDQPAAMDLTTTTAIVGSPLYMSPEQMANARDVDRRADIWSLGVMAYRLLTKSLPFHGENLVELAMVIASRSPKPVREHRPEISPALSDAIMRCLERDPNQRWPDVAAFVQAIAPYGPAHIIPTVQRVLRVSRSPADPLLSASSSGSHDVLVFDQSSQPSVASSTTLSGPLAPPSATSVVPGEEPARSRRGPVIALGIAFVAVGIGVGLVMANMRKPAVDPTAVEPRPKAAGPKPTELPAINVDPVPSESAAPSVSAPAAKPSVKVVQKPATTKPSVSAKPNKDVWGWGE